MVGCRFGWDNRWLFASLDDLIDARDALAGKLEPLLLAANPLIADLEGDATDSSKARAWASFQKRLAAAERQKDDPGELMSDDGNLPSMVLQTLFPAGDVGRDDVLLPTLQPILQDVARREPAVEIGLAGDVLTASEEHRAILQGMLQATLVTVVLVAGGLWLYFRTMAGVASLATALAVGVLVTFAVTRLTIGYLNVATAFLAFIVLGNGVNFGIMLLSRYAQALRGTAADADAGADSYLPLAEAIAGTWRGTLAAALTASVWCCVGAAPIRFCRLV